MTMEQYATLIIGFRRPDLVSAVLAQLVAQTVQPAHVVLVDNGGDLTETLLTDSAYADRATFVRRPENPGYSAAVNEARAVVAARGISRLLVLTHDAVFGPGLAQGLSAVFEDDRHPGAVAPLLRLVSRPDRVFSAGGRLTRNGRAWNSVTPADPSTPYEVDWVDGAVVMYRADALESIDWLDERYFLYFEDVDTSWRLRRAGWTVMVAPRVEARQEPGAHPMYLGIRNMTLFAAVARIGPVRNALGVGRRVAEESVHRLLHRRPPALRDAWRGWRDGRRGVAGHPKAGRARG